MPPEEQNVIAILIDGTEVAAYLKDGVWWAGQEDNKDDIVLDGVVSWYWPD